VAYDIIDITPNESKIKVIREMSRYKILFFVRIMWLLRIGHETIHSSPSSALMYSFDSQLVFSY
jgi:hypothetical protein